MSGESSRLSARALGYTVLAQLTSFSSLCRNQRAGTLSGAQRLYTKGYGRFLQLLEEERITHQTRLKIAGTSRRELTVSQGTAASMLAKQLLLIIFNTDSILVGFWADGDKHLIMTHKIYAFSSLQLMTYFTMSDSEQDCSGVSLCQILG